MLRNRFRRALVAMLPVLGMLALPLVGPVEAQRLPSGVGSEPQAVTKARVHEAFGKLPLFFVENQGQVDGRVAYYVQGRDTTVYFTSEGLTIALTGPAAAPAAASAGSQEALARPVGFRTLAEPDGRQRWAVKLAFVGANAGVHPTAQDPTPAVLSYFKGRREQWKTGLRTYASLVYRDLWPGIDLVFTGTASRLKYTFLVQPGADPDQIKLAYRGATAVRLTSAGELDVSTPVGGFSDARPSAYQEVDGRRVEVAGAYALASEAPGGVQEYGFRLGSYDRSRLLVLDPAMLVYAGYIGGAGSEEAAGIAVDSAGNAYITGYTTSSETTFPATIGPDLTFNGSFDAFVAKVNALGTALVYAGYIGGTDNEQGRGIAVDSAGNAYVTGFTFSSESEGFPVTVGPDLTFNGSNDAFVVKVNAAGTALLYAGYIGGFSGDDGGGIAVDSAGNAYVTGLTSSSEFSGFPVMVGPDLTHNGSNDAFVAKVNPTGTALVYAGYIGGASTDTATEIAVDSAGNAYVSGATNSDETTFPVTVGPDLTFNGGFFDAFVAKVNAAGTGLVYAGYIGGTGDDIGRGIAVDGAGNAYVAGTTTSSAAFPVMVGPDLTFNGGPNDAFVAKVNAAGTGLLYAGYIGGAGTDEGWGIAVDSLGNAYVTGFTTSSETTFPVIDGPDLTFNGSTDAFVAKVNVAGSALVYAGYIGGTSGDQGFGIAVDSAGNAYVTGSTTSSEAQGFPVTVGPDLTHNGGTFDAFVAKVGEPAPPGRAYVANFVSNSVSVIDTVTNTVVATVPVGQRPLRVAITPDGSSAYVTNTQANSVSVIDTATNTVVATVVVGALPTDIEITADGTRAYVANSGANSVSVINTATNTVMATVIVGNNPSDIAIAEDVGRAYVTNASSNTVSVIDITTNIVVATVAVGQRPVGVATTP